MSGDLAGIASRQWGLVTAVQAYECGFSVGEIKKLRADEEWWAPRAGIYSPAPPPSDDDPKERHLLCAAAALLAVGRKDAVLAHVSAGVLWGLEWYERPDLGQVWIAWPAADKPRYYRGLRILPSRLPAHHVTLGPRELPVTTVARTVTDLARELQFKPAVVVGESAIRIQGADCAQMSAALDDCRGWPGSRRARRAIGFMDDKSESAGESLTRVVLAELGFDRPEQQVTFSDEKGRMRVDFLFRSRWTIVEFDGKVKYGSDPDSVWREKKREDRLRRLGYEVVRLTYADVKGPGEEVRAMILAAFDRAARRGR